MTLEAKYISKGDSVYFTPAVAIAGGQLIQLPDGRAAYAPVAIAAGEKGAATVCGLVKLQKTANIYLLAGGKAFWDHSQNKAHFKPVNDRDFYAGLIAYDASDDDDTVYVALNEQPRYSIDMKRDAFLTVCTGTQAVGGFGEPKLRGGARSIEVTATNEAQCVDMLSVDMVAPSALGIVEAIIRVPANGSTSDVDFNIGAASATSTSDADAIAQSVFAHIDGGALTIKAESDDGTTELAATATGASVVEGSAVANRAEIWIDFRNLADVRMYINGDEVTPATMDISAATGPFALLAHLEKASGTATGRYVVDHLAMRTRDVLNYETAMELENIISD